MFFPFFARNFSRCQRLSEAKRAWKTRSLRFAARGGPVGQNTACEKVVQFRGETFGADRSPPQKCPQLREIVFFRFRPGISLSAKGCLRPKGLKKPVFRDFPPVGVRAAKMPTVKRLRNFREKLLGRPDCPPKSGPRTGKLCFSGFGPEFLSVPRAALSQQGLGYQYFAISRPWGCGWPKRKQ